VNPEVLARSRGLCEARCAPDCTMRAEHAHHVGRRWWAGNEPGNLLGVCHRCHNWIHSNVAAAERLGFLRRSGALPHVESSKGGR